MPCKNICISIDEEILAYLKRPTGGGVSHQIAQSLKKYVQMMKTNKTETEVDLDRLRDEITSNERELAELHTRTLGLQAELDDQNNRAARLAVEIEKEKAESTTKTAATKKLLKQLEVDDNIIHLTRFPKGSQPEYEHLREEYERKGWIKAKGKKVVKEAAAASSNGRDAQPDDNWDA